MGAIPNLLHPCSEIPRHQGARTFGKRSGLSGLGVERSTQSQLLACFLTLLERRSELGPQIRGYPI